MHGYLALAQSRSPEIRRADLVTQTFNGRKQRKRILALRSDSLITASPLKRMSITEKQRICYWRHRFLLHRVTQPLPAMLEAWKTKDLSLHLLQRTLPPINLPGTRLSIFPPTEIKFSSSPTLLPFLV